MRSWSMRGVSGRWRLGVKHQLSVPVERRPTPWTHDPDSKGEQEGVGSDLFAVEVLGEERKQAALFQEIVHLGDLVLGEGCRRGFGGVSPECIVA